MPKIDQSLSLFHTIPMNCQSKSRLSHIDDNCKNYDEVPGPHNLRTFLAANSTQNYFLIADTYVKFFVTFAMKQFFASTGRRGWPYSNGHGLGNRHFEERVHPNRHGDNVTHGVYFKSQRMEMEEGKKGDDFDMEEEKE